MRDLPDAAVTAAIEALSSRTLSAMSGNRLSQDAAKWAAVVAIEAAMPHLTAAAAAESAAAEREACAQLADRATARRIADLIRQRGAS